MGQFLLLLVVALTVAAVVFGVTVLATGNDPGLAPAEPDGRAVPLPVTRPLVEADVSQVRFDTTVRGYRMAQVDQALRRAAYDIGYKDELIGVLEAEVTALREGRPADADALRRARQAALVPAATAAGPESADLSAAAPAASAAGPAVSAAVPAGSDLDQPDGIAATSEPNGADPAEPVDPAVASPAAPVDPAVASPAAPVAGEAVATSEASDGSAPTASAPTAVEPSAAEPSAAEPSAAEPSAAEPSAAEAGSAVESRADKQPAAGTDQPEHPDQPDQARGPVPSERA
jgi:DivIVA domain-containing protein